MPVEVKIVDVGGDHRYVEGWAYGLADVWPAQTSHAERAPSDDKPCSSKKPRECYARTGGRALRLVAARPAAPQPGRWRRARRLGLGLVPEDDRIVSLGAKGVGEIGALGVAAAISNAICTRPAAGFARRR